MAEQENNTQHQGNSMSTRSVVFIEVYKSTLEFFGKVAIPVSFLVVAWIYQDDVGKALKGLKVDSIESSVLNIKFVQELAEEFSETEKGSKKQASVISKIEATEEGVRAAIERGDKKEIPTVGVLAPDNEEMKPSPSSPEWQTVLAISWVKPNDLFGRTYYLPVNGKFYIWPLEIDAENDRALFVINTSSSSRDSGRKVTNDVWIKAGSFYEFVYDGQTYKLNLVDIRNAGKLPSKATFISVEQQI